MSLHDRTTNSTLISAVFTADRTREENVAFLEPNGQVLTYGQSLRVVEEIVVALHALGVGGRDRVGFLVPRGPTGALGFLAISSVATCCPLNPRVRSEELRHAIATMGITALVTVGDIGSHVEIIADLPTLALAEAPLVKFSILNRNSRSSNIDPGAPEFALVMQTSGTTSLPKLVELSCDHILSAARAIRDAFILDENDLCLNPMPLHHVHGLISASLSSLVSGSRVMCTDGFSTKSFEHLLNFFEPTWFTGSPAMHLALLDHFKAVARKPTQGRLRFFRSSSAPLPASAIAALEELFNVPLIETYGLTETASMICANPLPPAERKSGSVGIAFGSQIRITDELGTERAPNENGEVVVRGPSVITKYGVGGQDAFFGDWLRTGDLGYKDLEGYLYIVGRTKELIKRGGLSVYPAEIDNVLMSHPDVAEAVTFSIPHPTLGEELIAAVVARAGSQPTDQSLRSHLGAALSAYKVPAVILVIERIPKNETGKILRRSMANELSEYLMPKGLPAEGLDEMELLAAWIQTLGREDFGVTDNVFLLGADPLRAERVVNAVVARVGASISVKDMLAMPTVREQAAFIVRSKASAA